MFFKPACDLGNWKSKEWEMRRKQKTRMRTQMGNEHP